MTDQEELELLELEKEKAMSESVPTYLEPKTQRIDSVESLRQEVNTPYDFINHPIKSALKPIVTTAKIAAIPFQRAESALAAGSLELQKGQGFGPAINEAGKGIIGQNQAQFGDVYKEVGLPQWAANTAGLATTIAITPGGAKSVVDLVKGGSNLIRTGIDKSKNYIVDTFTGAEKAKNAAEEVKFLLRSDTSEKARGVVKRALMKADIERANQEAISSGYDNLSATLKKIINKEADKKGIQLQEDLPKLFGKKSAEYGAKRLDILKSLPEDKQIISSDKVVKGMEDSLVKYGILRSEPSGQVVMARAPLTPIENQIFNLYQEQKKFNAIPVEDLIKTQKYIEPQYGKAFSPDEKLSLDVARGFDNTISEHIPAFKELKKEYAPFLKWKEQAINKLQPFNSKYDVATGILSKSGSTSINPSEQRLLAGLRSSLGSDVEGKIPALQKGLASIPEKQLAAKQASLDIIKKVRADAARRILELRNNKELGIRAIDKSTEELIHKYGLRKIKLAVGAGVVGLSTGAITKNAIDYFFRREVYSGIHSGI